jgi:hypothetical protein
MGRSRSAATSIGAVRIPAARPADQRGRTMNENAGSVSHVSLHHHITLPGRSSDNLHTVSGMAAPKGAVISGTMLGATRSAIASATNAAVGCGGCGRRCQRLTEPPLTHVFRLAGPLIPRIAPETGTSNWTCPTSSNSTFLTGVGTRQLILHCAVRRTEPSLAVWRHFSF